jgi:hypothetical protein
VGITNFVLMNCIGRFAEMEREPHGKTQNLPGITIILWSFGQSWPIGFSLVAELREIGRFISVEALVECPCNLRYGSLIAGLQPTQGLQAMYSSSVVRYLALELVTR